MRSKVASLRSLILPLAVGSLAALGSLVLLSHPFDLVPGEPAFRRLVAGATPSGRVHERAVVSVPGLRRASEAEVRLELEAAPVRFGIDGSALTDIRPNRDGILLLSIPPRAIPGLRIELAPERGAAPLSIRRITFDGTPPPFWPPTLAFLVTFLATAGLTRWRGPGLGFPAGLATASFTATTATPAILWLSLPSPRSLLDLALPFGLAAASVALGGRSRAYFRTVGVVGALLFGVWVRCYFLPSAGSWDTEYWKAWTSRAVAHGVTHVYGDAEDTPDGHFVSHLLGREDLFQIEYKGRDFVVDYPPLAMVLWKVSFGAVTAVAPHLDRAERENVVVKLPAVIGDVASVLLLLFLFRSRPERGLAIASIYWALPLSWLPSAVLGFLDAAYAPVAVLGLVAAGRGRAAWSGILVALAGMVKPQGLIVGPAAMAMLRGRRALAIAVLSGLAAVGLALVPFALAGTLQEAVTHVFRILFQKRLSAGFANPWWVLGHIANGGDLRSPVNYAGIDALPFPAGLVGTTLFVLALVFVVWRLRRVEGIAATCLGGATLVFAYGVLAMGVHENHPHSMFLAFAATGLSSRRLRALVGVLSLSYVLNMLSLSGLGRFYGLRYMALEPVVGWVSSLRMGLGIDLTLLLAGVNTALLIGLLLSLGSEIRLEGSPRQAVDPRGR